ncbi:tyrosine--tRNA ligase [Candidatus Saccharibacteria bacterium]|nr:tyrosine--tRNA ligase [Candidatus Saccharibacteria bacterium]
MKLSEELVWRGFYNQTTFGSIEEVDERTYTLYLGADPTGDSLHVGHLAVYMLVRQFLQRGHKVVLLIGGGTAVVGDPGGRVDERKISSLEEVAHNASALSEQVSKLFSNRDFTLVNNFDWLKDVSVLDFLRDVGKHFSVTQLVQRDFIASRIGEGGSGISYAEFSYTLLQGYDFWHLHKKYGVNLQIGGADQWGNIISGIELIRKKEAHDTYGMTAPLVINKSTGRKFGKSEGGAVWLSAEKTSPYKFYQFWLNTDDESVIDFLKIFTTLPKEEIDAISENHAINPGARSAQKMLARAVTDLVHGESRRYAVEKVTEVLFGDGRMVRDLDEVEEAMLAQEIPAISLGGANTFTVVTALVTNGLAASNGEARRLLMGGAIKCDGEKITEDITLAPHTLLKKGKNSFILVRE